MHKPVPARYRTWSRFPMRGWALPLVMTALWLWFTLAAFAQGAAPDASIGAALRNLSWRADVVFAGRVTAIQHEPAAPGSCGSVIIDFRVDEPLAGTVGGTYTLHEWGGLWTGGQHRYWVGERVAIFLHAPGRAGLSSPVDGMEGVLPIVQVDAQSEPLVDVRRVATRVLRQQGTPLVDGGNGAMRLSDFKAWLTARADVPEPAILPLPGGLTPPLVQEPRPLPRPVPLPVLQGETVWREQ